jgi:hypothetical protein
MERKFIYNGGMAHTLKELRALSDAELLDAYSSQTPLTQVSLDLYCQEINRRDQLRIIERQEAINRQMLEYTTKLHGLTVVIGVLTTIAVVAAVVSLLSTLWS